VHFESVVAKLSMKASVKEISMVELVALLKRKPELSREDFARRWLNEHTKVSSRLPGLLEYRINIATLYQPDPLYDGTAELWWESLEATEGAFASDISKIAGADADEFCEVRLHLYTEEHVVVRKS
jgi:uncharacterized protein (TIGR02118 family)